MSVNLQVWDNLIGQCLLVFLIIEGLKIFPIIARASRGSILYKILLNLVVNLVFSLLVRGTGNDFFMGQGIAPLVLAVVTCTLITNGLHRLKKAFERRSPSNHIWETRQGKSV